MELIGFAFFLFIVGLFVAAAIISAFFIWIGTKIAGVPDATFGRAVWAARWYRALGVRELAGEMPLNKPMSRAVKLGAVRPRDHCAIR